MSETVNISTMANHISKEIFSFFRWDIVDLTDENFQCLKIEKHTDNKKNHTHPTDVVFHYMDPYTNKRVYFNTDLKSYKGSTIDNRPNLKKTLVSLAKSIDCANVSDDWKTQYVHHSGSSEIRGLLFVYNHSGDYDKDFFNVFKREANVKRSNHIKLSAIPLAKNQQLHIIEPRTIKYLSTIVNDTAKLARDGLFPQSNYEFYYPELILHKPSGENEERPATIELLTSPYLIIRHKKIKHTNSKEKKIKSYGKGILIYYRDSGATQNEFIYLFDTLSRYQILDNNETIRIRAINIGASKDIQGNFNKAKQSYLEAWGFDSTKKLKLDRIEFEQIQPNTTCFDARKIGWEK